MFASWIWERALVLHDAATMLVACVTLEYMLLCLFHYTHTLQCLYFQVGISTWIYFMYQGIEPRTLYKLGNCSATRLYPHPIDLFDWLFFV